MTGLDLTVISRAITRAAYDALLSGAKDVEKKAKQKAPVRRIFTNRKASSRLKTAAEMEADRSLRKALGLSVEGSADNPSPRVVTGTYRPPRRWRDRRLTQASQLLIDREMEMQRRQFQKEAASQLGGGSKRFPKRLAKYYASRVPWRTSLSARGAYEVRRAQRGVRPPLASVFGHRSVGGYLREHIVTMPGELNPAGLSTVWVISEADYSKYQEFGTVNHAAQPFLRPAAAESRTAVVNEIARAVDPTGKLGTYLGKYEIEIVVVL